MSKAPGQLVDPKKTRVLAVVAGHQTPAASRTASLVVNGNVVATKKIDVPANGRATVAFESLDVPYGLSKCEVRIDAADGFAADDSLLFAVKRADPERVLFVHQGSDARSPLYFGAALAAAAQASFVLQPITPEQAADVDPSKYAFIVLSDVTSLPSILERSAAEKCGRRRRCPDCAGHRGIASLRPFRSSAGAPRRWALLCTGLLGGRGVCDRGGDGCVVSPRCTMPSTWPELKFFYASTVVDVANARVVARLADKTPLVLDKQIGEGHALVFRFGA